MRSMFHSLANHAARLLMKLLFACVARVRVIRRENANHDGGFLLAANHISHFDPFIISSVVRRKIDWMAMAEFFPYPVLGFLLRAVDAFPADRHRADRTTIRTAIERFSLRAASATAHARYLKAHKCDRAHRRLRTLPTLQSSQA